MNPSPADQLERGRAVLQLLLEVQRELARGTKPVEIATVLGVPAPRAAWALDVLAGDPQTSAKAGGGTC